MKRRQFLGFLGGAAVAGPKAAQAVAQATLTKGSLVGEAIGMPFAPYGSECNAVSSSGDWKVSRIAELKKLISGKNPKEERRREEALAYALESRDRARIDSLRSVSFVNKMRLYSEGQMEREERIRRLRYRWELADLMKIGG